MEIATTYPTPSDMRCMMMMMDKSVLQRAKPSTKEAGKYIHWINVLLCIHPSIHPFSRSGILCDFNHVLYVLFNTPFKAKGKCITAGFGGQTSSHPHSRSAGGGRFPVNVMSRLSGVCDTQMAGGLSSGPDGHQQ